MASVEAAELVEADAVKVAGAVELLEVGAEGVAVELLEAGAVEAAADLVDPEVTTIP